MVPGRFWEGVVLLGISPELIFFGGVAKKKERSPRNMFDGHVLAESLALLVISRE